MNLDSPHTWRWLWLVFGLIFITGELVTPATFFFLPFAIGAAVGSALCFANVSIGIAWAAFLSISVISFAALWRLGRRLEQADSDQIGVGSTRWLGAEATVETEIAENGLGTVRLGREEWRAQSLTGARIRKGSTVLVTKLAGVALIVVPVEEPIEELITHPEITGSADGPAQGASS